MSKTCFYHILFAVVILLKIRTSRNLTLSVQRVFEVCGVNLSLDFKT